MLMVTAAYVANNTTALTLFRAPVPPAPPRSKTVTYGAAAVPGLIQMRGLARVDNGKTLKEAAGRYIAYTPCFFPLPAPQASSLSKRI